MARAQQAVMPVVGFLVPGSADEYPGRIREFVRGLNDVGYIEGHNVAIEYRWANGHYDRIPELAAYLVRRRCAVIVASTAISALAAKAATTSIPIVFSAASDPVQFGLVANLNRPGGNLTGVTNLAGEVGPKRLEILHDLVPTATTLALLANPANPNFGATSEHLENASRELGLQLQILRASTEHEIDRVFSSMGGQRPAGFVIGPDAVFNTRIRQLAALTLRHRIPAIYQYREFAEAGGLMSYGVNFVEGYRLVGSYTGRILKGEKPAELPVQRATKVELVINLKTARALGLTVPLSLRGRADEVIE